MTLGTGGSDDRRAVLPTGHFGSTVTLDNLRVNIANGTTFPAAAFAQTLGAVEFTGLGRLGSNLANGSQLRLIDAAGTTNYDLTINGAQISSALCGTV